MSVRRERSTGLSLEGKLTGDSPKGLDVPNADKAASQFHDSFVLQLPEGSSDRLPVSPDHGTQTLVGVVIGYLDILTGHYPLFFTQKEDEVRQASRDIL